MKLLSMLTTDTIMRTHYSKRILKEKSSKSLKRVKANTRSKEHKRKKNEVYCSKYNNLKCYYSILKYNGNNLASNGMHSIPLQPKLTSFDTEQLYYKNKAK